MSTPARVNKLAAAMRGMQAVEASQEQSPQPVAVRTPMPVSPSRQGKRIISAYFKPEVGRQLRMLAIEQDASVQALMEEALNDLFRKHGKSAIA